MAYYDVREHGKRVAMINGPVPLSPKINLFWVYDSRADLSKWEHTHGLLGGRRKQYFAFLRLSNIY